MEKRITRIYMHSLPTQRYRRQAIRNNLDIIGNFDYFWFDLFDMLFEMNFNFSVSIGGIMGLFMGVSILSGAEFIYYFTVRIFKNTYFKENQL